MKAIRLQVLVIWLAAIGGCSPAIDPELPVRLGLFKGVDGITYSADGGRFDRYKKYGHRERIVRVSQSELADIVQRLTKAGLLDEQTRTPIAFDLPPQSYDLLIAWKDHESGCRWWHYPDYQIPEKYLDVLEAVPPSWRRPLLVEILKDNWRLHATAQDAEDLLGRHEARE